MIAIAIASALVVIIGPLLLGVTGWLRSRDASTKAPAAARSRWQLTISSALLYTLAFNLTFFIQELFLVVPKAFTPGLRPVLFHNNHSWEGQHPLASLFQGTGALALLVSGAVCALLLRRPAARSPTWRLFLLWMAYNGFFQSLPQVVIGAIEPRNDVGMAMDFLQLGASAKMAAALVALASIPVLALWLTRVLLGLAQPAELDTARTRTRFVFHAATLPALIAIPLIVLFRVPRELIEVLLPPIVVAVLGTAWMQAGAWRCDRVQAAGVSSDGAVAYPLAAVVVLLLAFHLLLRPGIAFY